MTPSSDIDCLVITDGQDYWREGRIVDGIPVDLFFNPLPMLLERLHTEDAVVIQGLATGDVVWDPRGIMPSVVAQAREIWDAGPSPLTDWAQILLRYRIGCLAEDLEDATDSSTRALLAVQLVSSTLEAALAWHRQWPVPVKQLLGAVTSLDPELGQDASAFFAHVPDAAHAIRLADRTLDSMGGRIHEYSSPKAKITNGRNTYGHLPNRKRR